MKGFKVTIAIFLLLTAPLLWLGLRAQPKKKIPFSVEAISSNTSFDPEWVCRPQTAEEEQETSAALSQPYYYLGGGGQCYAFVSKDNRYVIKFFKQKAFAVKGFSSSKRMKKKEEKRGKVFTAFKLSFDHLPKETGLLYVHLNKTSHLNKELSFCDAKGHSHLLNLDGLEFALQKKAELSFARIDALMGCGDIEGAKLAIDKLLELNSTLYHRGYHNRDPNIRSNCGFIHGEAMLIDVGRVVYSGEAKSAEVMKRELLKALPRFQKYLAANHPELLSYFNQVTTPFEASLQK